MDFTRKEILQTHPHHYPDDQLRERMWIYLELQKGLIP